MCWVTRRSDAIAASWVRQRRHATVTAVTSHDHVLDIYPHTEPSEREFCESAVRLRILLWDNFVLSSFLSFFLSLTSSSYSLQEGGEGVTVAPDLSLSLTHTNQKNQTSKRTKQNKSHMLRPTIECTVEPRFTNDPVHERFGSRTNFPNKNLSDDERCLGLRTRKLATEASWEYRRGSVSCWLTNLVSVYEHFGSRTVSRNELISWTEVPLYVTRI
jgi:hypothetical protein